MKIIWDFDNTIVEKDSDTYVIKKLSTEVRSKMRYLYYHSDYDWITLVNISLQLLSESGFTLNDIKSMLQTIPIDKDMISLIREFGSTEPNLTNKYEMFIASDANDYYIKTILDHHGISNCFSNIYTNSFNNFNITPYQSGHGCNRCASNMCKTTIVNKIRNNVDELIVYIGDGVNDYCPTMNLSKNDYVLVKEGFGLELEIKNGKEKGDIINANILYWKNSNDIRQHLNKIVKNEKN